MNNRERLIELLCKSMASNREYFKHCEHCNLSRKIYCDECEILTDRLLLNRVVIPPCKVGDIVYVIPAKENQRKEITPMKCLGFAIGKPNNTANLFDEKNKLYQPSFDRFGRTIFLTHEEAERALNNLN